LTPRDKSAANRCAGDLSVTLLRFISEGLGALGADWRAIFRRCGIDPTALSDSEARFARSSYDQLWPAAAKWTGDAGIGLHVGEQIQPRAVNILGYLLMSSATVGEGMERTIHYHRVIAGENWIELDKRPGSMSIRLISESLPAEARALHTEYIALLLLKLLSWASGDDVQATEVQFMHPGLVDEAEYRRILKCAVRFQCPENTILLSETVVHRPSLNANPEISQIHREFADHQLAEFGEESVTHAVAKHIASLMEVGPCDLPTLAKRQHMSPRTLQRRLADEGTTFQKILESVRRNLCLRHLEWAHIPLSEIAYLAGFADASSFNRAVRRWTGQTPLRYRQTHR
jgi:AraC-like DNA-binding protein